MHPTARLSCNALRSLLRVMGCSYITRLQGLCTEIFNPKRTSQPEEVYYKLCASIMSLSRKYNLGVQNKTSRQCIEHRIFTYRKFEAILKRNSLYETSDKPAFSFDAPPPRTMRTCVEATTFNRLHISFNIQISVHIMTTNETARALHELKLPGMASCWESLEETHQLDRLALRDGMQQMLQYECDTHQNNRIQILVKNANFRLKATIEELETDTTRGISAASANDLATCNYITNAMTLIIKGPTGTEKTYYACALDDRACRNEIKVLYITMNMLIENLKLVHLEGRETNFFRKLNAHDLLIIDDFGMVRLEGQLQHDFEQIIDDRYNQKQPSSPDSCKPPTGTTCSKES